MIGTEKLSLLFSKRAHFVERALEHDGLSVGPVCSALLLCRAVVIHCVFHCTMKDGDFNLFFLIIHVLSCYVHVATANNFK